jgi:hypothetical protein
LATHKSSSVGLTRKRMDLRELVRNALVGADLRAERRQLPRSIFRFGDLTIALRVDGIGATHSLLRMIATRASPPTEDAALIDVIGGTFKGHEFLLPLAEMRSRTVLRANDDIYYLWLNEANGYLTAVDRRARRGLVWFTAPDRIASWHVARPFLHIIKGLSLGTPWTPIHAASVVLNGKGILVVGQSGAGKTSIALTCALAGWDYLGDDAVIVRSDPARVGALYSSARLRADTFDLFPQAMTASLGISDDAGEPKAELDMALLGRAACGEAEIRAIVVPLGINREPIRLRPLSRSDSLRKLMEATRQSIMGDEPAAFAKLAALVASVPSYTLEGCRDPAVLTGTLAQLLNRLVPS